MIHGVASYNAKIGATIRFFVFPGLDNEALITCRQGKRLRLQGGEIYVVVVDEVVRDRWLISGSKVAFVRIKEGEAGAATGRSAPRP